MLKSRHALHMHRKNICKLRHQYIGNRYCGAQTLRCLSQPPPSWCSCLCIIPFPSVWAEPATCFWSIECGKGDGMSFLWLLCFIYKIVLLVDLLSCWPRISKLLCCELHMEWGTWQGTSLSELRADSGL